MPARITFVPIENVLEMMENKEDFTLVDVLDADAYAEGHIPVAISVPGETLKEQAPALLPDKRKTVVVYCASYKCHASTEAARVLLELGYESVLDYKAGKAGWAAAGLPLKKGT